MGWGRHGGPEARGPRKGGLEDIWLTYYPCGFQAPEKGQRRPQGCLAGVEGKGTIGLTDCTTKTTVFPFQPRPFFTLH